MGSDKNRLIGALILSAFLLFIMAQFTQTLGLFAKGFDSKEILDQFFFYVSVGTSAMVVIWLLFMLEYVIKKGDSRYGNSLGFASQGEYPAIPFFKRLSSFHIAFISLIVFSILGLAFFLSGAQQTFTGLKVLPQQFSPTSSLIFSSVLIPISENLAAAAVLAFLMFGIRHLARKYNWNKVSFAILAYFLIPLLIGIYGVAQHNLVYSESEVALLVVFIFWYIGGLITVAIGNILPFIIQHFVNNFLFDSKRLFDLEPTKNYFIIGIIVMVVLYVLYLWLGRKWKSWRGEKNINNIYKV